MFDMTYPLQQFSFLSRALHQLEVVWMNAEDTRATSLAWYEWRFDGTIQQVPEFCPSHLLGIHIFWKTIGPENGIQLAGQWAAIRLSVKTTDRLIFISKTQDTVNLNENCIKSTVIVDIVTLNPAQQNALSETYESLRLSCPKWSSDRRLIAWLNRWKEAWRISWWTYHPICWQRQQYEVFPVLVWIMPEKWNCRTIAPLLKIFHRLLLLHP